MRDRYERVLATVLTIAGVAMAIALVRREFFAQVASNGEIVNSRAPEYVSEWRTLIDGAIVDGDTAAPAVLVEFGDLECPFCARFNTSLKTLRAEFGTHQLSVAFIHYPLSYHRFARPGAVAAECALKQGRFYAFIDAVYAKQDSLGLKTWASYGLDAGIPDTGTFSRCAKAPATDFSRIDGGLQRGVSIGVRGTPTVLVNGWIVPGVPRDSTLRLAIRRVLAGKEPFEAPR